MYKMILLDLDGTLLNSEETISPYTLEVLQKVSSQAKIVLASARGFWRIKKYVDMLKTDNKDNYTIAFNGAVVVSNDEEKVIDQCIEVENVEKLVDFYNSHPEYKWGFYTYSKTWKPAEITDFNQFIHENPIYKIVFDSEVETINSIRDSVLQQFEEFFSISSSIPQRIEFVKKGATKMNSIIALQNYLNVTQQEVIACGDGGNDIEMIKYAGCGVAMTNASDKVKEAADIITDDNDHDGVGKAIAKLFNL